MFCIAVMPQVESCQSFRKIGQIQPKLLKALSLETRIISEKNWRENCQWAFNKITHNKPCALIIRRET